MNERKEFERYVDCIMSMSLDWKMKRGPTDQAFISNLRMMADSMEQFAKPEKKERAL